jgi:hypothetical protein
MKPLSKRCSTNNNYDKKNNNGSNGDDDNNNMEEGPLPPLAPRLAPPQPVVALPPVVEGINDDAEVDEGEEEGWRGEDDDGYNEDTEEPPEMGESTSTAATINR